MMDFKKCNFGVAFGVRRNVLNNSATSDASLYGWLFLSILMIDSLVFVVLINFRPYTLNGGRRPLQRLIICYYFCSISWFFCSKTLGFIATKFSWHAVAYNMRLHEFYYGVGLMISSNLCRRESGEAVYLY